MAFEDGFRGHKCVPRDQLPLALAWTGARGTNSHTQLPQSQVPTSPRLPRHLVWVTPGPVLVGFDPHTHFLTSFSSSLAYQLISLRLDGRARGCSRVPGFLARGILDTSQVH